MNKPFISVIIPAYKESKRIGTTLESLQNFFSNKTYNYEIIVVNDGSPDNTSQVLFESQARIGHLRIIDYPINRGKGYAVRCGMLAAKGRYRLFMDADNSVKIDTLDLFLDQVASGFKLVIGSIALHDAKVKENNGWYRRFFGTVSKWFIRTIATPKIYDTQRGFKLFTAHAANIIFPLQTINRFGFDIELLVIALRNNLSIKEIPVVFNNPAGSTVRFSDYFRTFDELFKIVFNKLLGRYDTVAGISSKHVLVPR